MTAPGNADGFGDTLVQATRLQAFYDEYGLDGAHCAALVDTVVARLHAWCSYQMMTPPRTALARSTALRTLAR